ncbi:hypothetical protein PF005_g14885 [Phytophthora fragariae]|uniref:Uncharacterized protein n=1 Tax=Phytophthora fragariae TaxID=53985 RepID=A0A6A3ETP8_9STRA|nr:hypothetical protein PF009_g14368 [Phytophthora fragariae]KAE9000526.1 hypothetical protein PF011_g14139 [Phytophthora fragariae]KAE9104696.1 hypothetical protein PF006_g21841 [Phytophthora fragariae]KAE9105316.1 hypothetical protein PF010_g13064 [Phytophthora fragariae]KAE9110051.1 hypothetical protein PF007_g12009 [Phytophthora fragariae]
MLASPLCMFLSGKAHALSEHALRGLREKGEGGAELSRRCLTTEMARHASSKTKLKVENARNLLRAPLFAKSPAVP